MMTCRRRRKTGTHRAENGVRRILPVLLLAGAVIPGRATNFVAYGDSRSNQAVHQRVVTAFCSEKPELVLHVGDLWSDYGPARWLDALRSNPVSKALLESNRFLVTKGNHESSIEEITAIHPSLVRNQTIPYAFTQGNCFFVCAGEEPTNLGWIKAQLASEESRKARWRILWAHNPCYSTGEHRVDGAYPGLRDLLDTYHVDLYVSGHDHTYERTHLMRDGVIVGTGHAFDLARTPGTVYVITGGAGAPLYRFHKAKAWSACRLSTYHYCSVRASDSRLLFQAKGVEGNVIDQFEMTR